VRLFDRFDALLREKGWLAMGGQIIDATVIEARRPRLSQAEKDTLKGGSTPTDWKPARRAQIDREGRWTMKRDKKRQAGPCDGRRRHVEIAGLVFGYKNHISIDREFGFVRRYTVTHAAAHDGGQLGAVLDGHISRPEMPARNGCAHRRHPARPCQNRFGQSHL
jgi:IS5 family transposase